MRFVDKVYDAICVISPDSRESDIGRKLGLYRDTPDLPFLQGMWKETGSTDSYGNACHVRDAIRWLRRDGLIKLVGKHYEPAGERMDAKTENQALKERAKRVAISYLDGAEISEDDIAVMAEQIAGSRHLLWKELPACNSQGNAPFLTTTNLSEVCCTACKRTKVYEMAEIILKGEFRE